MQSKVKRQDPIQRRKEILEAALRLAKRVGYLNLRRKTVASEAGTSTALVTWYFTNMDNLKREVMETAIQNGILPVIAQGLALGDRQAHSVDKELKQKALTYFN